MGSWSLEDLSPIRPQVNNRPPRSLLPMHVNTNLVDTRPPFLPRLPHGPAGAKDTGPDTPPSSPVVVVFKSPSSCVSLLSSSNYLPPHHPPNFRLLTKKKHRQKRIHKSPVSFLFSPLFFDFCFPGTRARGSFLSSFRRVRFERLHEKILSCLQKSSIWTLKPASRSPSASFLRHTRTAKRRPPSKPTKS